MAGIINNDKLFNSGWNPGGAEVSTYTRSIAIDPSLEKQYDYAMTDDIVLLNERKDNQEKVYEIFVKSPFFKKYGGYAPDSSIPYAKKIEKNDITKIFYYIKEEFDKIKKVSLTEELYAILEVLELDYSYVVNNVLSVPLKSRLLEEIWRDHQAKMSQETEALF